ncbi:hypothetical protein OBRU01_13313 [Operophtera brumata]|uniref:Uncharacterized protein n=1 Tax=Operophtera brumata TaxID=104452 RepID=A0A0L7L8F2_OPEBR|nr:hypothetical protein OBRU01_13313 [Operophtera brumata]
MRYEVPLFDFTDAEEKSPNPKKTKTLKRKSHKNKTSFVMNNTTRKGPRLIKIEVRDISVTDDNVDKTILKAQYIVIDHHDEIMDMTESVVNKISKNLCESDD